MKKIKAICCVIQPIPISYIMFFFFQEVLQLGTACKEGLWWAIPTMILVIACSALSFLAFCYGFNILLDEDITR